MDDAKKAIETYTKGIGLSEEVKTSLLALYIILSSKETLEILFAVKGNDPAFVKDLEIFFQKYITMLPNKMQNEIMQTIVQSHTKVLSAVLAEFTKQLPQHEHEIMQQNLKTLIDEEKKQ